MLIPSEPAGASLTPACFSLSHVYRIVLMVCIPLVVFFKCEVSLDLLSLPGPNLHLCFRLSHISAFVLASNNALIGSFSQW